MSDETFTVDVDTHGRRTAICACGWTSQPWCSHADAVAEWQAHTCRSAALNGVSDVLRDVWDSFRDDREGFIDYLLDPNRSGLRVEVVDA